MGELEKFLTLYTQYGYITVPMALWLAWAWHNWRIFHKESDPPDGACLERVAWLNQDHWSDLYIRWLGALLDGFNRWIGDGGQNGHNALSRRVCRVFAFDHNPWTESSFNVLFRIALVYPILSLVVFGLMGGSGKVGDVALFPANFNFTEAQRWPIGLALFVGLSLIFWLIRWLRGLSGWRAVLALMLVVLLILSVGKAGMELGEVLVVIAFLAFLIVLGGLPGLVLAWAFLRDWSDAKAQVKVVVWDLVVAFAFAFAGAGAVLYENLRIKQQVFWFWLVYLALALWGGFWMIRRVESNAGVLFLFWIIFPLLNAPLDWLSLGITRGLLHSIRTEQHSGWQGFSWALLDLVIAVLLLLLMSAVLLIAVDFANDLRLAAGKSIVLDLQVLFEGMGKDLANPDYYWIYFMLFTTLLPTLIHCALAGATVLLWFPRTWRSRLVNDWQHHADKKVGIWFYVSVMPVLGFVIAPGLLLYGLWTVLSSGGLGMAMVTFFAFLVA